MPTRDNLVVFNPTRFIITVLRANKGFAGISRTRGHHMHMGCMGMAWDGRVKYPARAIVNNQFWRSNFCVK